MTVGAQGCGRGELDAETRGDPREPMGRSGLQDTLYNRTVSFVIDSDGSRLGSTCPHISPVLPCSHPALPASRTDTHSPMPLTCVPLPRVDAGVPEKGLQDGQVALRSRHVERSLAILQREEKGSERGSSFIVSLLDPWSTEWGSLSESNTYACPVTPHAGTDSW